MLNKSQLIRLRNRVATIEQQRQFEQQMQAQSEAQKTGLLADLRPKQAIVNHYCTAGRRKSDRPDRP